MNPKKQGKPVVSKVEKIVNIPFPKQNTELLTLTYGGIVAQIIKDSENVVDANEQLDKMGFNIGQRLIDEYLAVKETKACTSTQEIAENIAKNAFPMFLGVVAEFEVSSKPQEKTQVFMIHINDNPLNDFVELPEHLLGINYSGIIAGAIRGALSTINWIAKCNFIADQLKGQEKTTISIEMVREKFKDDD